jgi:integrase
MRGARPLTDEEISLIYDVGFTGEYALRNRVLFLFRLKTGLRISEALSLLVSDLIDNAGNMRSRVYIRRRNTKGKDTGRSVALHPQVIMILNLYLTTLDTSETHVFASRKGVVLDKKSVWKIEKQACIAAGVDPSKVSTHSTRKTFAKKAHSTYKFDVVKTARALGHKDLSSTMSYLSYGEDEIDEAFLN